MAQVTMTGIEFRNMIKMEDEREELLNIFVKAQQVTFAEDNVTPYSAGTFVGIKYPEWVEKTLITCMEAQLLLKAPEELNLWFKSGHFYYNCVTRSFSQHSWDDGVHMLEYSDKLRERYEEWMSAQSAQEVEDEE